MIFYKLLCIPPNLEILLTSVYTFWCLCSREILSFNHLLDKINVCWSTNDSDGNFILTFLRYSVSSVHIFQFIFAYAMLAAEILTIYPILFNKSAKLLNPIIIASTFRQIYSNTVAVILGALLCYFSGSNFREFQCFFGRFMINFIVSYYIIFSYEDFQRYIQRKSSSIVAEGVQRKRVALSETKSENSFLTNSNLYEKNIKRNHHNDESINRMRFTPNWNKILPSQTDIRGTDSMLSTASIETTEARNAKETFLINFINHKTKENLLSFKISKQN